MDGCIFCGSPSAKWLSHIQVSSSVKMVNLCEFHMEFAAKVSVKEEYTKKSEKMYSSYKLAESQIVEMVREWAEKHGADDEADYSNPFCLAHGAVLNGLHDHTPERELIRVHVDESEFDRWLCMQIKKIANEHKGNKLIYRCIAKNGGQDGRCRGKTNKKNGYCERCLKFNRTEAQERIFEDKIEQILEIIKSPPTNKIGGQK